MYSTFIISSVVVGVPANHSGKKSRCCPLLIMSIMPNQLSQKEEKKPDIIKRGYRDTSASERIVEGLKKEASKQASKNKYSQKNIKGKTCL